MNIPKKQKDPVCGMSVNSEGTAFKAHHKNKEYNFCCKECLNTFKNDPEKYSK